METKLSERKHKILIRAIEDYISDACPITSGAVQQKHLKEVSSATLRNELNALEAMGYLKQLHTSSGRVPTTEGYKYYVSWLLDGTAPDEEELERVREVFEQKSSSISEIISQIAQIVSQATNYPTVIVTNGYDKLVIDEINIVPLIDKQALMLLKTKSGVIHNTFSASASQKNCQDAGHFLTKTYRGKTIGEMVENFSLDYKNLQNKLSSFIGVVENVIKLLKQISKVASVDIRHEGSAKLLVDSTLEQAKNIFNLLEDEEALIDVVDSEEQDGITLDIDEHEKLSGYAVVKAPIILDGKQVATVGVLGPERMDYAEVAAALKLVINEVNEKDKYIDGGN